MALDRVTKPTAPPYRKDERVLVKNAAVCSRKTEPFDGNLAPDGAAGAEDRLAAVDEPAWSSSSAVAAPSGRTDNLKLISGTGNSDSVPPHR